MPPSNALSRKFHLLPSPSTPCFDPIKGNIFLIYQFFVHSSPERHKEIQNALRFNVENQYIQKIFLLNEKIYSEDELGIKSDKIKQINLGKRITFKNVFDFIHGDNLKGYCITCNADIFFDKTLENLYTSNCAIEKKVFTQLRFEYTEFKLNKCKLFKSQMGEYRADSQDTWIFHSDFNIEKKYRKLFNFIFGKRGCDNKITYLFYLLGYKVHNEPFLIKTYHIHNTAIRDYGNDDIIHGPYLLIGPRINKNTIIDNACYPISLVELKRINFKLKCYWEGNGTFVDINYSNEKIKKIIKKHIGGIFNIVMLDPLSMKILHTALVLKSETNEVRAKMMWEHINAILPNLKKHEGVLIRDNKDYEQFCMANIGALENADMCIGYTQGDHMIRVVGNDHADIMKIIKDSKVPFISKECMELYHTIHQPIVPWTHLLKGKRILLLAPFVTELQDPARLSNKNIYGYEFFQDNEIVVMQTPSTFGEDSRLNFGDTVNQVAQNIHSIRDTFDIALIAANGYSNTISAFLKSMQKSSIVVGNLLYLWFGIYTNNDMQYRSDILKMYMSKHWVKAEFPHILKYSY
jgi:hypothetical protein